MSTQAMARLGKELRDLMKYPVGGFKVELVNDDDMFNWRVYIEGPSETVYEGGVFRVSMEFPEDYPNSPPKMKFVSDFWHPNVYEDGRVCISILHVPDPTGMSGESDAECWRPIQTVESVLVSVCSMLSDPNFSSPACVDASVQWRKDPTGYKRRVRALVEKSKRELPANFEMPKPKAPEPEPNIADEIWDEYDEFDDFDEDDFLDDDDEEEEGEDEDEEEDEDEDEEDEDAIEEDEDEEEEEEDTGAAAAAADADGDSEM